MESKASKTGHYNALIWLLMTEYEKDKGYTPSKYLIDSIKPKLIQGTDLPLEIVDSTLFDFTIANGIKDYFDLFFDKTRPFENALIILSYYKEKYIPRDFYLANLAKSFTCWDVAYINCDIAPKVTTKVFDYVIAPNELPGKLTEIITNER